MTRSLVAGRRARGATAVAILAAIVISRLTIVTSVLAASPTPSGPIGGDPRSAGQGPGLVGDPATAVLVVLAIGLAAVVLTLAYVKLTGGRRS